MKLKTNENYIKGSRKNIKNQKNKYQIEKKIYITNQEEKNPTHNNAPLPPPCVVPPPRRRCCENLLDIMKECF